PTICGPIRFSCTAPHFVDKPGRHTWLAREGSGSAIFSTAVNRGCVNAVNKTKKFFHLHLISDATGETLLAAGRAAAAQYADARAIEHIYPLIRTEKQLFKVLEEIDAQPGIVLYTIIDVKLASLLDRRCKDIGIPCVSVLEPVISVFQSYLGSPAGRRVGAQHVLDAEY